MYPFPFDFLTIQAQWYQSAVSLLKHQVTECHFLTPSSGPKKKTPGGLASSWRSYPPGKGRYPTSAEMSYVLWAIDHMEEIALPTDHEYRERLIQANKPNKDKFLRHSGGNYQATRLTPVLDSVSHRLYGE
jgi:hypothetical protein